MKKILCMAFCLSFFCTIYAQFKLDIHTFRLSNGLKVLVNRDTTVNEVSMFLLADAGSRKENKGQYGYAHLFEHVMLPTRYYLNPDNKKNQAPHIKNTSATVHNDYIRYYVHFDKNAIDFGLVQLADRLDFQIDSVTPQAMQGHIKNVINEIGRNESFGNFRWRPIFRERLAKGLFGEGHMYGNEQTLLDISKATAQDMGIWFKQWYGAANAVLVLLGDVDMGSIKEKVDRYFGAINPGKLSQYNSQPIPLFKEKRKEEISLRQDKHMVYYAWAVPGYGTVDNDYFELVQRLLVDPANNYLKKELSKNGVKSAKPFTGLETYRDAAVFDIVAEFTDWAEKERIEKAFDKFIQQLQNLAIDSKQLTALSKSYNLSLMLDMEGIGIWDGRIKQLSEAYLFTGNAKHYQTRVDRLSKATPATIKSTVIKWINNAPYVAIVKGENFEARPTAYNYKTTIPPQTSSPPKMPTIKKELYGKHLTAYYVPNYKLPIVNYIISLESNTSSATENNMYANAVQSYFEKGATYEGLSAKGSTTSVSVKENSLNYSFSTLKENEAEAKKWLTEKLSNLSAIKKETTQQGTNNLQVSLQLLKNALGFDKNSVNHTSYPLQKINLFVGGSIDQKAYQDILNKVKFAESSFVETTQRVMNAADTSFLIVKEITEAPESNITLTHQLRPSNMQEEVYQSLLMHMLNARLYGNLRGKYNLIYELYPNQVAINGQSITYWQTSTPVEKTKDLIGHVKMELAQLTTGLDAGIVTAKSRLSAEILSMFNKTNENGNAVVQLIEFNRNEDYYQKALELINNLNAKDFEQFLKEKTTSNDFKLVVLTVPKQAKNISEIYGVNILK
jgi:predicted Zn-dependent peptidase